MTCGRKLGPYDWKMNDDTIRRFWSRVQMNGPLCWDWQGAISSTGYGIFMDGRKALLAHRVSFVLTGHLLDEGSTVDHLCRNRKCVNPSHLRAISLKENILCGNGFSASHARKTVCPKCGGSYTQSKTGRRCIPCRLLRRRQRYAQGVWNA